MHHYILCLREKLKGSTVKIVELYPPAVQSMSFRHSNPELDVNNISTAELHDAKHQPDIKNGSQMGMPLDQFTNEAYEGLAAGKEEVAVEGALHWYNSFEPARQEMFYKLAKAST